MSKKYKAKENYPVGTAGTTSKDGHNYTWAFTFTNNRDHKEDVNKSVIIAELKRISDKFSPEELLDTLITYSEYCQDNNLVHNKIKDIKKSIGLRTSLLISLENKLKKYNERVFYLQDSYKNKTLILSSPKRNPLNLLIEISNNNELSLELDIKIPTVSIEQHSPFEEYYSPASFTTTNGSTEMPIDYWDNKTYFSSPIDSKKDKEWFDLFHEVYQGYLFKYWTSSSSDYSSNKEPSKSLNFEKKQNNNILHSLEAINVIGKNLGYIICKTFGTMGNYEIYVGSIFDLYYFKKDVYMMNNYKPQIISCYSEAIPYVIL